MPISVGFRWANDGIVEPAPDATQSSLSVSGQSALFNYSGRWALIRLLRDHMIREAKMPEPRPLLLEFKIPTRFKAEGTDDEKQPSVARKTCFSQVYLRVAIQAVEKPQKAGQKPTVKNIIFPRFPWHAPDFGG
jgi:type VI secretion system protein ImpL